MYKNVCVARDSFKTAVFALHSPEGVVYARFCLALLNPIMLYIIPVTTVPREDWPTYFISGGLRSRGQFDFSAVWQYDLECVLTHDIFSLSSVTEITVVMDSCCIDGFHVGSYSEALPLQTVWSALEFENVAEKKIGPQGKKKDAGRQL
eukprot:4369870-Amphidinium_carterae.1